MTKRGSIVAVYAAVSQVDEPVFGALAECDPEREVHLIYWNDSGLRRSEPDPELGLTPVFPEVAFDHANFGRKWLDSRSHGLSDLHRMIVEKSPRLVILNDLNSGAKLKLALRLRRDGIKVAYRSDKNRLSEHARHGLRHFAERGAYRALFDVFCPTSRLAQDYYRWPSGKSCVLFPYATDLRKFGRQRGNERRALRKRLGIPPSSPVLLAVTKFVPREGPADVIDAYFALQARVPDAWLIMVGSGPDFAQAQARLSLHPAGAQVRTVGYVPFDDLAGYFDAADIFLHLARSEPWGVSVSDALAAGLAVLTTDHVGAGIELLGGDLQRYVTPVGDAAAAAAALEALVRGGADAFAIARERVWAEYSTNATANRLASFGS